MCPQHPALCKDVEDAVEAQAIAEGRRQSPQTKPGLPQGEREASGTGGEGCRTLAEGGREVSAGPGDHGVDTQGWTPEEGEPRGKPRWRTRAAGGEVAGPGRGSVSASGAGTH